MQVRPLLHHTHVRGLQRGTHLRELRQRGAEATLEFGSRQPLVMLRRQRILDLRKECVQSGLIARWQMHVEKNTGAARKVAVIAASLASGTGGAALAAPPAASDADNTTASSGRRRIRSSMGISPGVKRTGEAGTASQGRARPIADRRCMVRSTRVGMRVPAAQTVEPASRRATSPLLQGSKEISALAVRHHHHTASSAAFSIGIGIGVSLGLQGPPSFINGDSASLNDTCDVRCRSAGGRECVTNSEARLPSAACATPRRIAARCCLKIACGRYEHVQVRVSRPYTRRGHDFAAARAALLFALTIGR